MENKKNKENTGKNLVEGHEDVVLKKIREFPIHESTKKSIGPFLLVFREPYNKLLTAGRDFLHIWNSDDKVGTNPLVVRIDNGCVAFEPFRNDLFLVGFDFGEIVLYSIIDGKKVKVFKFGEYENSPMRINKLDDNTFFHYCGIRESTEDPYAYGFDKIGIFITSYDSDGVKVSHKYTIKNISKNSIFIRASKSKAFENCVYFLVEGYGTKMLNYVTGRIMKSFPDVKGIWGFWCGQLESIVSSRNEEYLVLCVGADDDPAVCKTSDEKYSTDISINEDDKYDLTLSKKTPKNVYYLKVIYDEFVVSFDTKGQVRIFKFLDSTGELLPIFRCSRIPLSDPLHLLGPIRIWNLKPNSNFIEFTVLMRNQAMNAFLFNQYTISNLYFSKDLLFSDMFERIEFLRSLQIEYLDSTTMIEISFCNNSTKLSCCKSLLSLV